MDFKQIEAFVNVVKYKKFSKAADASFLTQPTISTHINNLEKELNVILLNRQGREITMTKQGETFYSYAVNILNLREQATLSIQGMNREIEGVIELQTSSIPGQYYVPKILGEFRSRYPGVKIFLEQSDSRNVMDNIINQKGEIGFTGTKLSNNLVYEEIFSDDMILITPNKGKFAKMKDDSIRVEEIVGENFILREDGSGTKKEFEKTEVHGISILKMVNVIAHMNNTEAIKNAVISGVGISVLSACAASDLLANEQLKCFKIAGLNQKRHFYMVRNRTYCLSPAAERFWEYVLSLRDDKLNQNYKK